MVGEGEREREEIPVLADKNEITLVVESDDAAAGELGNLREQRGEHTTYPVAHTCCEVVQYQFRVMRRHNSSVLLYPLVSTAFPSLPSISAARCFNIQESVRDI